MTDWESQVVTYTYDALYRLTEAEYSTGEYYHYTYDAVGNRLSLVTSNGSTSYEYDAANRLTSVNGVVYTWDANGNLLDDGVRSYVYDHANRLIRVVSGTLTTEFTYNGVGDRVVKMVNGVETQYTPDPAAGLTQVLVESTGEESTSYLYGHDLLAQYDSGTWAYHVNDGLGSVRQLADPLGQVVAGYNFSPFGVPLGESGGDPYGFTGEQWDASTGLVYLRARYYEPGVGRFISRDPWEGNAQRPQTVLRTYTYVGNNPATYVDPTGMWRWWAGPRPYHFLIENYYEGSPLNPSKQLEYPIPGTPHRHPDMFNSVTGDVYEIEPWFLQSTGVVQVTGYVADLLAAAGRGDLAGKYFGIPYNWNLTPFHVGTGGDWPGKFRIRMPGFPAVDLVADYVGQGVVIYWLEPNALSLFGALPFVVPNKRLVKPPNWVPGLQPAYQPAYVLSWQEACGYTLVVVGGIIIVVTVAEDLATLGAGTFDDAVTVPAGILFINWGQRLAVFVPASGP